MTLQKILGKNYKWWFVLAYENKIQLAYFWSNIAWMVARIVIVLSSILIWSLNPSTDRTYIFTYLIIGNIWLETTEMAISLNLAWEISTGKISRYLMAPASFGKILFFRTIGRSLVGNFQSLIVLLGFGVLFLPDLQGTLNFWWLIPVFLITILIKYFLAICLGFLAFWFVEVEGFVEAYRAITIFLAGNVIPLNLIPNFGNFLVLTPFAFTFYHPMQIYLGKYNTYEILTVILTGIFWSLALWVLSKFTLKLGLKRNESVGL